MTEVRLVVSSAGRRVMVSGWKGGLTAKSPKLLEELEVLPSDGNGGDAKLFHIEDNNQ